MCVVCYFLHIFSFCLFYNLKNNMQGILGFQMTSRPPCWCPKQRKGGHVADVGAPTKSSGNLTLLCKRFLLFSLKNMAVDQVSENQQFYLNQKNAYFQGGPYLLANLDRGFEVRGGSNPL